jgi:vancomycin resistance protein VanW
LSPPRSWRPYAPARHLKALSVLAFLFLGFLCFYLFWLELGGRVFPNVTVGTVPAGQMTGPGLREELIGWLEGMDPTAAGTLGDITFHDPVTTATWTVSGESLGLAVDVEQTVTRALSFGRSRTPATTLAALLASSVRGTRVAPVITVDEEALEATLTSLAGAIDVTPGNVTLDPGTGAVRAGWSGRLLNSSATREALCRAAEQPGERAAVRVDLVVEELPPRGSVERLSALDRDPLSSFTTWFDRAEVGRSWNIALSAASLDGTVVESGEELSFNHTVGWRTAAAGYRVAPEIVNDELVPGIGGGVCQVATTVFNAGLLADLEVVQRHRHSRPLSYIGLGRDATVAYPALDLVLRNPGSFPVILTVEVADGRLAAGFWGRRTVENKIRLLTEETARVEAGCVVEPSDQLPPGAREVAREPFDGRVIRLWREVTYMGHLVRRELIAVDRYEPVTGLIRVGPPPARAGSAEEPADGPVAEPAPRRPWSAGR